MTVNQLPALTSDLDQAARDITTYGLCLVDGVLSPDQLSRARTALYEAAADDRAQGREQPRFGLDFGDDNQRERGLVSRRIHRGERPLADVTPLNAGARRHRDHHRG